MKTITRLLYLISCLLFIIGMVSDSQSMMIRGIGVLLIFVGGEVMNK